MDIALPVYLYDVVNSDDASRVVISCRTEQAAIDLVAQLNAAPRADGGTFYRAPRRVAQVTMAVEPGSSVIVRGYEVASDVLAAAIASIPAPVEEAPVEDAPVEEAAP